MTTTNGTEALVKSRKSRCVLVGAFVNASAVAQKSAEIACKNEIGISLVLAGQENHFALEDFICAGGIIERLPKNATELSDKALATILAFKGSKQNLLENINQSQHAQELLKIGFGKDIEFACQIDVYNVVPYYQNGRVFL